MNETLLKLYQRKGVSIHWLSQRLNVNKLQLEVTNEMDKVTFEEVTRNLDKDNLVWTWLPNNTQKFYPIASNPPFPKNH